MERSATAPLRIGDWRVDPALCQISRHGEAARLEERSMRLLLCLADRRGEVVSIDELLDKVWSGVAVSPDSVYQAVASLRRQLGDDSRQPVYIATVPRLGYRMLAAVSPWEDRPAADPAIPFADRAKAVQLSLRPEPGAAVGESPRESAQPNRMRARLAWAAGAALCAVLAVAFLVRGKEASGDAAGSNRPDPAPAVMQPQGSIAVLPFLDLTEGMKEEEFADGMTEELIDKLSKIPGLKVPAPTAVFYFKGKQLPVAEMARSLGVAYVLDGSVRKSGGRVRVAARLIRADNGYVAWSESYDRPFGDILMVQDDIAGEVTKALKTSIGGAR